MMATFVLRRTVVRSAALVCLLSAGVWALPGESPADAQQPSVPADLQDEQLPIRPPNFQRMARDQAETDRVWRAASAGVMQMEKIVYRSRADDLEIPAFVFQPLQTAGPGAHPAIIWVHENIRGHLYEHYIQYVRDATARGYVVVAPEYRGSVGYGRALYDAIDYGGAEVDDVVTAVSVIRAKYPQVDPSRIAVVGWSHGGLIGLLSVTRNPGTFKAVAAMVPVTNLFHRLASKGPERQRQAIDPHNRFGGPPWEKRHVYRERSPLFQVDRLDVPVLVHLADNDEDVEIEEGLQLIDALRARKPGLAETKIYNKPRGGHRFDRIVGPGWVPVNTPEQRDSWNRVWSFLDSHLRQSALTASLAAAAR
jgi:dipeptidyl aminopeptidase/acylaminoacyl peptidase